MAIAQAAYNFRPRIDIQPATALDERDPTATLFRITNLGPWVLYDVRPECSVSNGRSNVTARNNIFDSPQAEMRFGSIKEMEPNKPITRECLIGGKGHPVLLETSDPSKIIISFSATFSWPLISFTQKVIRQFTVRRSPDGAKFLLVPDIISD
jgi:hypothetical protein